MSAAALAAAAAGALLAALPAPVTAAQARAETVTLRFAWPAGLEAQVEAESARVRAVGEREQSRRLRSHYRLVTEPGDDGGIRVTYADVVLEPGPLPEGAPPQMAKLQAIMERAASAMPGFVVGADGRLARVEGLEAAAAALREALSPVLDEVPAAARPRVEAAFSRLLAAPVVEARLAEAWNRDVGAWAGMTLERGRARSERSSAPAPALGGMEVPMAVDFEYLGPATCRRGGTDRPCARLRLRSRVDSARVGEALERFVDSLTASGRAPLDVAGLEVTTTVDLTTEPATLVPHAVDVVRETALTIRSDGREVRSSERRTERIRYRYP